MKFTLSWLKRFIDTDASLERIAEILNKAGLEVEEIVDRSKELSAFIVAEIIETKPHPNADKLQICKVNDGNEILQIVCGAPNAREGIKVILAKVGTIIPNGNFKIKSARIREVESSGMLCSEQELIIGKDSNGIVELPQGAEIGEEFSKYYGLNDPQIELSVTPNRADCFGVYYIAKELAAYGLGKLKPTFEEHQNKRAEIKNFDDAELFSTLEVNNLTNKESPLWLQNLLRNIGQTPISAVVDITNFMSISFARPMHAYDKSKLNGDLSVSYSSKGEKFNALDDKEYELSEDDLVIKDKEKICGLAGIIGGKESGCDSKTKNVVLESAVFDPILVTKSGRRHKIETDARQRFERGVDKAIVVPALHYAASLMESICGGKIKLSEQAEEQYMPELEKIEFDLSLLSRYTGQEIAKDTVIKILQGLAIQVIDHGNYLYLTIPSYRHDLKIAQDIIEEIIRVYGYENIIAQELKPHNQSRILTSQQRRVNDSIRMMASRGYQELYSWSFMDSIYASHFTTIVDELKLKNPISQDLDYMRPTILPNLLHAVAKNKARSIDNLQFFETGPIFGVVNDEIVESECLSAIRTGVSGRQDPHDQKRADDIYDLKADLEVVLGYYNLSMDKLLYKESPSCFHPYRSNSLYLGKTLLGHFGVIHPSLTNELDIDGELLAFELILDNFPINKLKYGFKGIKQFSAYQKVSRDFAFVMDKKHQVGDIMRNLKSVDKNLIQDVSLFDVYEDAKIGEGKHSLAFNVSMQSMDKTLDDAEINKVCDQITRMMTVKFEAELRS